jgi:16S rRNA (cytosine1402-N4)-methyltransferase
MLTGLAIQSVDGAIADLGLSSYQLDDGERGYTVDSDSRMDMRYDLDAETPTAADILKTYSEKDLVLLFQELAEQPFTRRIAKAIKSSKPIITPADLAEVVEQAIPSSQRYKSKKITVNLLRALRMEVNHELDSLEQFIEQVVTKLNPQARLAIISFQSLEDRVVKNAFRKLKQEGQVQIVTKKPVSPTESEIQENPRSRSAKLRVCEKL